MDWFKARDAHFLGLQTAVFCVACELISENNTPHCLACGSQALISLSRVLGGSLHRQQTAHLIADAELDRLVHELIQPCPSPQFRSWTIICRSPSPRWHRAQSCQALARATACGSAGGLRAVDIFPGGRRS